MEWNDNTMNRSAYPNPPTGTMNYDEFLRQNSLLGNLKIQASRAQRALPTAGVHISVIGRFDNARVLFFDGVTDADGIINNIQLPAPPRSASLQSQAPTRGAIYQVFANHPDFEPEMYEVEIFQDITSILPVVMRLPQEVR